MRENICKQEHSQNANLRQRQNFNQKLSGIRIRINPDVCRIWGRLKMRERKTRHQYTKRVENARLENAAPVCRGWKMRDRMLWNAENAKTNKTVKWLMNTFWRKWSTCNRPTISSHITSMYVIIESMSRQKVCGRKKYIRQQCKVTWYHQVKTLQKIKNTIKVHIHLRNTKLAWSI